MNDVPAVRFRDDLRAALHAWRRSPGLPLFTVAVWAIFAANVIVPGSSAWVVVLFMFLAVVFIPLGAVERAWYRRIYNVVPTTPNDVAADIGRYWVPFVLLGLFGSLICMGVSMAGIVLYIVGAPPWIYAIAALGPAIVIDVLFTFVTPAVVESESVATGWVFGTRLIRATWPRCAPHVLAIPLTLVVASRLLGDSVQPVAMVVIGLVALAAKGATMRFYLRERGVLGNPAEFAERVRYRKKHNLAETYDGR